MNFREFQKAVHALAVEKGWWNPAKSPVECHMLMVTEIAEATEEARKGTPAIFSYPIMTTESDESRILFLDEHPEAKPEGELVELADCVIRIMDYCEHKGWDLSEAMMLKHEYNKTRSHRHGGKKY